MKLAKIIGHVTCTQLAEQFRGQKLLILQPVDSDLKPAGKKQVGVDVVNSGTGDLVMFVGGSSARRTGANKDHPCDCAIIAAVNQVRK